MKGLFILVLCSLATGLFAASPSASDAASGPVPETALPDVYSLQLSFFSPGVVRSADGLSFLSPIDILHARSRKTGIDYASVYCPVDIGFVGSFRGHATYSLAVNLFGNGLADDARGGYKMEGVVPSREETCLVHGLQVSGLGNILEAADGIQLTGGLNSTSYFRGIQVAGIANHAFEVRGVQVAGLLANICESLQGVQIGLFNISSEACGLQLGLFNCFMGRSTGLQIGLLNKNVMGGCLPLVNMAY